MAEELISALAKLEGLRVAARTSAFRFRGAELDIREIGRQLNVGTILEGSLRKAGDRLRIGIQLINVENGYHPIAPYGTPSTDELAEAVVGPIRNYDVLLLANHGALTAGESLEQAEERMYQLEHFAQISLVAELLGGPKAFSIEEVERLSGLREKAGGRPVPPACYPLDTNEETITLTKDELIALVADAVRTLRLGVALIFGAAR